MYNKNKELDNNLLKLKTFFKHYQKITLKKIWQWPFYSKLSKRFL